MAKSEDGEFELILGNRQLLSVFFIVVILLGVFFTMGYIVGRNSAPVAPEVAAVHKETKPQVADSPARQPEPAPVAIAPSSSPTTTAAQHPATEAAKPAPPARETKSEPVQAEPKAQKPAPPAPAASSDEPAPGQTYLQLAATNKREADIMVDVLHQKKFKALAAEIPERRGTFRVLVGPLADEAVTQMRADLQGAGFPGNAGIKRTF